MDTLLSTAILNQLRKDSNPQTATHITTEIFPMADIDDSICWSKVGNTLDALVRTKEIKSEGISWANRKYSIL